jgi:glycosyltransferase involved in cell wall biosynthesis
VLVTRCGGPEALVSEASGMVVPPRDAQALAAALASMLGRLETYDRAAIAQAARERYGYDAVGAALSDVYFDVLAMRRHG